MTEAHEVVFPREPGENNEQYWDGRRWTTERSEAFSLSVAFIDDDEEDND